jgi:hypothetical protein
MILFRVILRIKNDYFSTRFKSTGLYKGTSVCFLWGWDWIFKALICVTILVSSKSAGKCQQLFYSNKYRSSASYIILQLLATVHSFLVFWDITSPSPSQVHTRSVWNKHNGHTPLHKNTLKCVWKKKQQRKIKQTCSLVVGVENYMKRLNKKGNEGRIVSGPKYIAETCPGTHRLKYYPRISLEILRKITKLSS